MLGVVLRVVLDVLLVRLQVFDDVFLLPQFGVEVFGVRLELVRKSLLWLTQELGFVSDSLQERVVDLGLDVVLVVLALVLEVVSERLFDVLIHLFLFLVEIHHHVVVRSLLLGVNALDFLHILTELAELLDLWSKRLLPVLDFLLDLTDDLRDLLKSLVFLVVQSLLLAGHALDLVFDV